MVWNNVIDLTSPIWYEGILASGTSIPLSVKLDAIRLYHLKMRATEEIEILKNDMKNTYSFYIHERELVKNAAEQTQALEPFLPFEQGCLVLLHQELLSLEATLRNIRSRFMEFVDLENFPFLSDESSDEGTMPIQSV